MAYFYCDAATGSDANNGTTWALAEASIEAVIADASAGDTIFVRANASETTPDTLASSRTLTSTGTVSFPIRIIGVKTGTTNEGASVVGTDLAVKSGDQPVIEVTGAGNDINMGSQYTEYHYINFSWPDRLTATNARILFHQCDITCDNIQQSQGGDSMIFIDCDITVGNDADAGSGLRSGDSAVMRIYGGSISSVTSHNYLVSQSERVPIEITGCDLSGLNLTSGYINIAGVLILRNCKIDAAPTLVGGTMTNINDRVEMIGCSATASVGNTSSIQDYNYEDVYGTVESETTVVRTGGASDGAAGAFSYQMQPSVNGVLEGSLMARLKSPWMSVWVAGGSSITLTVYIVNDTADYTEEEIFCEFYTPDASDTAQHTFNIQPNDDFLEFASESTTAVTDDTGSTWATVNTFKQKFSRTVTPGFEGFAYARVSICKRQTPTPAICYVDPKIEVV